MNNFQNSPRRQQQRGVSWIRWLIPLAILLIVVYSPSMMSFFVSVAIIVLIWGLIAAASARTRPWTPPLGQHLPPQQPLVPISLPPEPETPYEQGYRGIVMTPQPAPSAQGAEEERLAQLKLIGRSAPGWHSERGGVPAPERAYPTRRCHRIRGDKGSGRTGDGSTGGAVRGAARGGV